MNFWRFLISTLPDIYGYRCAVEGYISRRVHSYAMRHFGGGFFGITCFEQRKKSGLHSESIKFPMPFETVFVNKLLSFYTQILVIDHGHHLHTAESGQMYRSTTVNGV